jgi:hypothetical protein
MRGHLQGLTRGGILTALVQAGSRRRWRARLLAPEFPPSRAAPGDARIAAIDGNVSTSRMDRVPPELRKNAYLFHKPTHVKLPRVAVAKRMGGWRIFWA